MEHFNVNFKPDDKTVSIHAGASILEAAAQAGIVLNAVCGQKGTCGKCIVNLAPDNEEVKACQHKITCDLTVTIPQTSRFYTQQILHTGIEQQVAVAPCITKEFSDGQTTVCFQTDDALNEICTEPGNTTDKIFGIAIDIGTTTVVAKLINLVTGKRLATASTLNPQAIHGDDVISRISFAETDKELNKLNKLIIDCLNDLIDQLCSDAKIESRYIYEMTVAGNTTMNHILLKLPIKQLGQSPFNAYSTEAFDRTAAEMNIKINPAGNIHTIENIAGFVGSDTTAVALAGGMNDVEAMTLVIDIGTNGELVLGTKDKLYAASCAAGPALEGARIAQGSRAVAGAIESVVLNGSDIDVDVIAGQKPATICGSGLIDAVALMLDLGVLDSAGRILAPDEIKVKLSEAILGHFIEIDNQPAFVIAKNDDGSFVALTQRDIRQFQLAKAAIRTGQILLQNKTGITDDQIESLLLAGAFGNYIRKESALRVGLLPNIPLGRIHFVGNAASSGAEMILLNRNCRTATAKLADKIEYIEIASELKFNDVYADCLMF